MTYVVLACRVLVAGVFCASVASKVRGRTAYAQFRRSIVELRLLPARWSRVAAAGAVLAEGGVVLLLALPGTMLWGFVLAGCVLATFIGGIAVLLRRGRAATCRCFGASSVPLRSTHLMRNGLLAGVAATGVVGSALSTALPRDSAGSALAVAAGAVGVLLVVRFDDIAMLFGDSSADLRASRVARRAPCGDRAGGA